MSACPIQPVLHQLDCCVYEPRTQPPISTEDLQNWSFNGGHFISTRMDVKELCPLYGSTDPTFFRTHSDQYKHLVVSARSSTPCGADETTVVTKHSGVPKQQHNHWTSNQCMQSNTRQASYRILAGCVYSTVCLAFNLIDLLLKPDFLNHISSPYPLLKQQPTPTVCLAFL